MTGADVARESRSAEKRIRPHIRKTAAIQSPVLSERVGGEVFLKLETDQVTGSFKARGAFNKLLSVRDRGSETPVVTASSGNHGHAMAHALEELGGEGIIYLPLDASEAKVQALRRYGVELRQFGDDCIEAELEAQRVARENGWPFVSPYSDSAVIAGQGTVGTELLEQVPDLERAYVAVGGGGLIAGVGGVLKSADPSVRIIGCQPEASHVMCASVKAGRILDMTSEPTLADGTAGGVDPQTITLALIQEVVDRFVLVSESEIAEAMRLLIEHHQILVEGAGALTVAALLKGEPVDSGQRVVCVLSGKKVSLQTLRRVLAA